MKRLLITGGTGMLGHALIRLYHADYQIRFSGRNRDKIAAIQTSYPDVEGLAVDLGDPAALRQACAGMDAVIHCAALSSPWGKAEAFHQHNVIGTQNLIDAMEATGAAHLVHISTPSVYFAFRDEQQIPESQTLPTHFCNEYAKTKAEAESRVKASTLTTTLLRPRGIFGPEDTAIVPRLLRARRNGVLTLPSSRQPLMDLTYVDNVADAAILALNTIAQRQSGEIYNITNGEPCTLEYVLGELFAQLNQPVQFRHLNYAVVRPLIAAIETVCRCLPHQPEPVLTRYSAALLNYHQTLDIRRAQTELGYAPHVSINEGIQRYAQWHLSQNA
uniref:NAD-dependent epimerase/dehydratase family protein n=1 Tax=Thaumasiovibrio occultus TaxID=1891184 RepID=UPI000B35DDFB|nr:NAD-dependent epimerase/dehydratase family protein [Thaumasiovibrio occultus]